MLYGDRDGRQCAHRKILGDERPVLPEKGSYHYASFFVLVFAAVFSIVTMVAKGGILKIYTSEIPVIAEGIRYLKWLSMVYFFQGLSVTCTIVLRSVGQVKVPLIGSIFSFFVNLIANYAFIFGKLGYAPYGDRGRRTGDTDRPYL